MHLHALDYVMWLVVPCLQLGVLVSMRRRGLASQFPFFYKYTIFQVATDVFLFGVERFSYRVYFYSYWVISALTVLLTFALVDELFRLAFRNFTALRDIGAYISRWAMLLVLLAACATAFSSRAMPSHGWSEAILGADRIARAMLCALAVLLLLGARYLRVSERSVLFGIALGFAFYMAVKVMLDSVALRHLSMGRVIDRLSGLVYIISCVLWLVYAMMGDALPAIATTAGRQTTTQGGGSAFGGTALLDTLNLLVEDSMRKSKRER